MEKFHKRLALSGNIYLDDIYLVDDADHTVAILPVRNSNRHQHARLFEHAPLAMRVLAAWVSMMEVDHADEIASNHHGDGPHGCTYCKAIVASKAVIAAVYEPSRCEPSCGTAVFSLFDQNRQLLDERDMTDAEAAERNAALRDAHQHGAPFRHWELAQPEQSQTEKTP